MYVQCKLKIDNRIMVGWVNIKQGKSGNEITYLDNTWLIDTVYTMAIQPRHLLGWTL